MPLDFRKLVSFDGRLGRGAYWGITITLTIVMFAFSTLLSASSNAIVVILVVLVMIAAIVVSLATSVKRWHDRNKSGLWVLIALVPIIGALWALIEAGFLPGTDGDNRFGAPSSGSPFAG